MRIFFSGIGGVGLGPLAEMAQDAGYDVVGSDLENSPMITTLRGRGIEVEIGQDGTFLEAEHKAAPLDWFVYTAALAADHPELTCARELGLRIAKRDELLSYIIANKNLKLVAITGTHGKTTTTGMVVWLLEQLGVHSSYSVGSSLSWGPSGVYRPDSEYLVYECDEFDRNFLEFTPYLSLITTIDYDHSDTYPSRQDYFDAFLEFVAQSAHTIGWQHDFAKLTNLPTETVWQLGVDEIANVSLVGKHNRQNATLAVKACEYLGIGSAEAAMNTLSNFPGMSRRFEKLGDNLYSDYAHHPAEIAATLSMARELSEHVVVVYQPHQNIRQHVLLEEYKDCFTAAEKVYWLPTYLSREDPALPILHPEELVQNLTITNQVETSELSDGLWQEIEKARDAGKLVLTMGAGSIDAWVREKLSA